MSHMEHNPQEGNRHEQGSGSVRGVLAGVADVGASVVAGGPRQMWESARHGTEELASALPESQGMASVKHFIQRHPIACTCAALGLAYLILGRRLPIVGSVLRTIRG